MAKKPGSLDEFELALGVATLAPPEAGREIEYGLMKGETAEQINRRLNKYRPNYKSKRASSN